MVNAGPHMLSTGAEMCFALQSAILNFFVVIVVVVAAAAAVVIVVVVIVCMVDLCCTRVRTSCKSLDRVLVLNSCVYRMSDTFGMHAGASTCGR